MSDYRVKSVVSGFALLLFAQAAGAQSLAGRWEATVTLNDVAIPFRMDISGEGSNISGCFFNGDDKVVSTGGRFEDGSLVLDFAQYATQLRATLKDGRLAGQYKSARASYVFQARPFVAPREAESAAPSIAGLWEVAVQSPKGESAWRLIVRQTGADVSAAILRVDGDTGALTGSYRDGRFVLSHFSGARPALLVLTPSSDGTLAVTLSGFKDKKELIAVRPDVARAKGLPEPTDPEHHTTVKEVSEPLRFSFPDLNGHLVSNTDARFEGKVVLVNITGSWCPNCHDEAPFLAALYRQYRNQGVEIVALSFEEAEQLKNPERLRAFVKQYGIEYTVLIAGEPGELHDKLPQAVNLNCWPTTFILGRDGRVRGVHAGFPGHASGALRAEAEREFTASIDRLLAENLHASQ
ncbi:MAG: TlpA disulfide reductase family protein [Bryobacteraceae bacterium]|jgi:peroxiredoxin